MAVMIQLVRGSIWLVAARECAPVVARLRVALAQTTPRAQMRATVAIAGFRRLDTLSADCFDMLIRE